MSGFAHELRSARVGGQIAAARRSVGLTQRQLADALGTSIWTVERMEAGAADTARYLATIADVTHRQRSWFLGSTVPEHDVARVEAPAKVSDLGAAGRALVLGSIALLVTIRFFTEVVPVLPRAANFVDIPIFLGLAVAAAATPVEKRYRASYLQIGLPATAFFVLSIASAMVNSERSAPAPVLVFVYGFLAPFAIYAAAYRIWPPGSAGALSRMLVGLGLFELAVVAVIDVPNFVSSGNPDEIGGTFGTNPYQLVFFLLVVATLLAGISALEPRRTVARFAPFLVLAIFAVVLLAQYRALLATTVVMIVVVGVLLGRHTRGILVVILTILAFGLAFSYIASSFPSLKLKTTAATLSQSPWSYARQRYEATGPVVHLYEDDPRASVVGTGPGTFSSRAWQTFANAGSTSGSNVHGNNATTLTGGVYETDVSQKYVIPYRRDGAVVEGSSALSSPYSSYLGLAAEVGLLGLAIIVGTYLAALLRIGHLARRTISAASGDDPVPALALATTIGFLTLLQMGLLENWLEVTRVSFVVWAMFAVVLKELDARSDTAP